MERLTVGYPDGAVGLDSSINDAVIRLADYEDTGLTPEDIKAMYETVAEVGVPLWKIKELWQVEEEGRLEVVRCKDCKYLGIKDFAYGYCENGSGLHGIVRPESYCSRGERKEDKA